MVFNTTFELKILKCIEITTSPSITERGHRGCDHMVVEFITTYAISAYHH
jgi:hypothetical protein